MDAIVIDAFEFCRAGGYREGEIALADLPRLAAETVSPEGVIRWSLNGGAHDTGHPQMMLNVTGKIWLECQRCLGRLEHAIESESRLVLAVDESDADRIEALIEDDDIEVIPGSRQFNVSDLIEDEALLAIPPSPKHESCVGKVPGDVPESKAPSPFEALKKWKQ